MILKTGNEKESGRIGLLKMKLTHG